MDISKCELTPDQKEHCKEAVKRDMSRLTMASQSYDKGVLGLSTATLGYTFAFAHYFQGNNHSCLLAFTWFFLVLSIVFVLISFIFEQFNSQHTIKYYFWCLTGKSSKRADRVQKHWSDDEWMILPISSGGCFLISIVLFTIFVGINL